MLIDLFIRIHINVFNYLLIVIGNVLIVVDVILYGQFFLFTLTVL